MKAITLVPDKEAYSINEIIENAKRIYNFNYNKNTKNGKKFHMRLRNKFFNDLKNTDKVQISERLVAYSKNDVLNLFNDSLDAYFKKIHSELSDDPSFYYVVNVALPKDVKTYETFPITDNLDSEIKSHSDNYSEIALINGYAICELLEEYSIAMNTLQTPKYISDSKKFKLRKDELRQLLNLS
ncbi:hypothetical protein [Peptostreptococcus stomatis]|uniref:hypothetical protein n=1 Tax=Peptostreptococcus stomatis TaxID=341694 RepID=UPI0028E4CBD3|nr:hypothetical protein [Peptostreptococcus stomatis]